VTAIHCSQCGSLILNEELQHNGFHECTGCGSKVRGIIFPAYHHSSGPAKTEPAMEGESSCFFHPHKRAVVPCDECGRFLCTLCQVELGDRSICPGCVATGANKTKLPSLQTERRNYDTVALSVAFFPALPVWPSIFTAPIAIYLCIRYWNQPVGILPRSRWRLYVALTLATLQVIAWVAAVLFLIANWRNISR